jgi:hypothetical protein
MVATAFDRFQDLVSSLADQAGVEPGQMFGKACLKIHGKAFLAQHMEAVVFKLTGPQHAQAIGLAGAKLWDPSGKGRPMREWIALPVAQSGYFDSFASAAMEYVSGSAG